MRFPILRHFRSAVRPSIDPAVTRDADELMQLWGAAAFDRAADLSSQEDLGLVSSPRAGHWWSVRREIGRRLGQKEAEPQAGFAA